MRTSKRGHKNNSLDRHDIIIIINYHQQSNIIIIIIIHECKRGHNKLITRNSFNYEFILCITSKKNNVKNINLTNSEKHIHGLSGIL